MAQRNFYPNSALLDTSRETLYNIAMSHRSHCKWRPTLWPYYTDGLNVPRHAQHCDGQWLILDSYCASFKLLYHVVGMRVLTSNYHITNDTWPDAHYRIAVGASPDAHCVIALWRRIGFLMELLVTGKNKSRIIFPLNGIMSYPCICLIVCHIRGISHSSFNVTWYNIDFQLYRKWHVTGRASSYCGTRVAGCALCYRVVTSHGAI